MSLVEAGSLVGGVIGSPVSLDMKKVDGAPPTTAAASTSRPPQHPQSATGGGGSALSSMSRPAAAGSSYNPAPTRPNNPYNGSVAAVNR